MTQGKIAIPTNNPGGLKAMRSSHFGHCDTYTIVDIVSGGISSVESVENQEHGAGGCLVPVSLLKDLGVNAILVGGIGGRPLQAFAEKGIQVYFAAKDAYHDAEAVVDGFLQKELSIMDPSQACKGSGKCHSK